MEQLFKLNFLTKIKKDINTEKKFNNFLINNKENIINTLKYFVCFEALGLSYKDKFKYEIYAKPEFLKKTITDIKTINNVSYEYNKGEIPETYYIVLIFLKNLLNNYLNFDIKDLQLDLYNYLEKYEPLNVDSALKMRINSNSVSIENLSNNWLNRTRLFIYILKNDYTKEEIYNIVEKNVTFTNNNDITITSLNVLLDLFFIKDINKIKEKYNDFFFNYIETENTNNNNIYNSLKIIINNYENNDIYDAIKNIIIAGFDTNINLSTFILLKLNNHLNLSDFFHFNDFILEEKIQYISSDVETIFNYHN